MDTSNADQILERIAAYKSFDEARHNEIEKLAKESQQAKATLAALQSNLNAEKQTSQKLRQQAEAAELAIKRKQFTLVLIDGDGYLFNSNYFRVQNESAGAEAAQALETEVKNYLKANNLHDPAASNIEVIVYVFYSKTGLARAMLDASIIHNQAQLDQFCWSFTKGHTLFQFIDCGPEKETVISKIGGAYRFFCSDAHCKYIFLGCCHDNDYVAELGKSSQDMMAARKTLFIRHATMADQFSAFPAAQLGSVFESAPLLDTTRGGVADLFRAIGFADHQRSYSNNSQA